MAILENGTYDISFESEIKSSKVSISLKIWAIRVQFVARYSHFLPFPILHPLHFNMQGSDFLFKKN
jgi:hypothetical protein